MSTVYGNEANDFKDDPEGDAAWVAEMQARDELLSTQRAPPVKHAATAKAKSSPKSAHKLVIGDDVELAQFLADGALQGVVYAEGEFWRYGETHWKAIPSHELSAEVRKLSGMRYGKKRTIAISGQRIKSILSVLEGICVFRPIAITDSSGRR
jgi:hypothetical protein